MTKHRATAVSGRAIELAIREGVFTADDVRRGLDLDFFPG